MIKGLSIKYQIKFIFQKLTCWIFYRDTYHPVLCPACFWVGIELEANFGETNSDTFRLYCPKCTCGDMVTIASPLDEESEAE